MNKICRFKKTNGLNICDQRYWNVGQNIQMFSTKPIYNYNNLIDDTINLYSSKTQVNCIQKYTQWDHTYLL